MLNIGMMEGQKYWKDGMMEEWENGRKQGLKNAVTILQPTYSKFGCLVGDEYC